jgi:hypothetical protein
MRFQSALIAVVVLAASVAIAEENLDESKAIEKIELLRGDTGDTDFTIRKQFTVRTYQLNRHCRFRS